MKRALALALVACTGAQGAKEDPPAASARVGGSISHTPDTPPRAARTFRFASDRPRREKQEPRESPVSLTSSEGSGLVLAALRARAVVDDPLALTELHLTFENPEDRVLEGRFRLALPPGASLTRFAMLVGDRWQEGEVVELEAARRAYEDTLHRKQDPALLEQAAGNEFSARVFPIPARGTKQIIVSYAQELTSRPYALPLAGLPRLGELDVEVIVRGTGAPESVRKHATDVTPDADFVLPTSRPAGRMGLEGGDLAVLRVTPVTDAAPVEIGSLLVLFDTSASRGLGLKAQADLVRELASGMRAGDAGGAPLVVAAFDQEVVEMFRGTAAGFGDAEVERLVARKAMGASDLSAALAWAAGAGRFERVLLVSDGVVTAGEDQLDGRLAALRGAGATRLDAIAVGGIRDEAALRRLATALPQPGVVIDGQLPAEEIAARLTRAGRAHVAIAVEGAEWWYPHSVDGVQAGDEVLVYVARARQGTLRVVVDGRAVDIAAGSLAAAERPLLERAAAQAHIAALLEEKAGATADRARALRDEITRLSVRQRVISPYTAMLVLESDADYARYKIDRRALADILTVGDKGIALVGRQDAFIARQTRPNRTQHRAAEPGESGKRAEGEREEKEKGGKDLARELLVDEGGSDTKKVGDKTPEAPELAKAMADPLPSADQAPAKTEAAPAPKPTDGVAANEPPPPPVAAPTAPPPRPAPAQERRAPRPVPPLRDGRRNDESDDDGEEKVDPYTGAFREVMSLVARRRFDDAVGKAQSWHERSPGDVLALVALGEALEAAGQGQAAARAYGSLIDLFPDRADLRRFAGERLDRLKDAGSLALAVDSYRRAAEQRPDHPSSHRLLAFALVRAGQHERAFEVLAKAMTQSYPEGRFAGAYDVLAEDLGLVAAAWIHAEPARDREIRARLRAANGRAETGPSLRFVLVWETDANDVDFHIRDAEGNHAYYSSPQLATGGRLYADVTTGYGPECFTIRGKPRAYPYTLEAHYYSRGPMGYGMGKLEIIEHDGNGGLRFEERPFVIMQDHAYVALGKVGARRKN